MTNRHTIGILRAWIHRCLSISIDTHQATVPASPFLTDHPTLLVNLLILQRHIVAPVVQNQQTRVQYCHIIGRNVTDVIYGFIHTGIGVQVVPEFDSMTFAPIHNALTLLIAREVLRAVECHVFQEVSQTTLSRLLLNGTHLLGDVELHSLLRFLIMSDVISQSVIQVANADSRIHWDRGELHLLAIDN